MAKVESSVKGKYDEEERVSHETFMGK